MPSPLWTRRFIAGQATASADQHAVVPTGVLWVIRSITVNSVSPGATNAQILITGLCYVACWPTLTAYQSINLESHQVVNAGEELQCVMGTGSAFFMVSGYQLTTP